MLVLDLPPHVSGVYRVRNLVTGDCYIGASKDAHKRAVQIRSHLTNGSACGELMRKHGKKYGANGFAYEMLIICEPQDFCLYEGLAIKALSPTYNCVPSSRNHYWPIQKTAN